MTNLQDLLHPRNITICPSNPLINPRTAPKPPQRLQRSVLSQFRKLPLRDGSGSRVHMDDLPAPVLRTIKNELLVQCEQCIYEACTGTYPNGKPDKQMWEEVYVPLLEHFNVQQVWRLLVSHHPHDNCIHNLSDTQNGSSLPSNNPSSSSSSSAPSSSSTTTNNNSHNSKHSNTQRGGVGDHQKNGSGNNNSSSRGLVNSSSTASTTMMVMMGNGNNNGNNHNMSVGSRKASSCSSNNSTHSFLSSASTNSGQASSTSLGSCASRNSQHYSHTSLLHRASSGMSTNHGGDNGNDDGNNDGKPMQQHYSQLLHHSHMRSLSGHQGGAGVGSVRHHPYQHPSSSNLSGNVSRNSMDQSHYNHLVKQEDGEDATVDHDAEAEDEELASEAERMAAVMGMGIDLGLHMGSSSNNGNNGNSNDDSSADKAQHHGSSNDEYYGDIHVMSLSPPSATAHLDYSSGAMTAQHKDSRTTSVTSAHHHLSAHNDNAQEHCTPSSSAQQQHLTNSLNPSDLHRGGNQGITDTSTTHNLASSTPSPLCVNNEFLDLDLDLGLGEEDLDEELSLRSHHHHPQTHQAHQQHTAGSNSTTQHILNAQFGHAGPLMGGAGTQSMVKLGVGDNHNSTNVNPNGNIPNNHSNKMEMDFKQMVRDAVRGSSSCAPNDNNTKTEHNSSQHHHDHHTTTTGNEEEDDNHHINAVASVVDDDYYGSMLERAANDDFTNEDEDEDDMVKNVQKHMIMQHHHHPLKAPVNVSAAMLIDNTIGTNNDSAASTGTHGTVVGSLGVDDGGEDDDEEEEIDLDENGRLRCFRFGRVDDFHFEVLWCEEIEHFLTSVRHCKLNYIARKKD
eukprot:Nk52_evm22s1485 gene=Nk52_evmTU22s1485